jgi:hypothetical protein
MDLTSPELAYLIAIERQQELLADAETPSSGALRGFVARVRGVLAR